MSFVLVVTLVGVRSLDDFLYGHQVVTRGWVLKFFNVLRGIISVKEGCNQLSARFRSAINGKGLCTGVR